jgi:hypothetical protein
MNLLAFLLPFCSFSQKIEAKLDFLSDTIAIGRPIPLRFEIKHPDTTVVLFPRSTTQLGKYMIASQEVFPTKTVRNISTDAIIYYLQSFEIADKQAIELSYAYLVGNDTLRDSVQSDSVKWVSRIPNINDSLTYKHHLGVLPLKTPANIWLITFVILSSILLLIGVGFLLKNPIMRYLQKRFILREWGNLRKQISRLQQQIGNQPVYLDEMNKLWKDALEQEDGISFRSMTTTELIPNLEESENLSSEQKEILIKAAKAGDKVIYAGIQIQKSELESISEGISSVLEAVFQSKMKTIK